MKTIMIILATVVVALVHGSMQGTHTNNKKGPGCYTCNYSIRDSAMGMMPWYMAIGHRSCRLETTMDEQWVDKWPCKSGVCFVRQERSGFVYRGCANAENLPFGVSSSQQCLAQPYTGAVWWFCQGNLCNNGTLGDSATRCSDEIDAQAAAPARPSHPVWVQVQTAKPAEPEPASTSTSAPTTTTTTTTTATAVPTAAPEVPTAAPEVVMQPGPYGSQTYAMRPIVMAQPVEEETNDVMDVMEEEEEDVIVEENAQEMATSKPILSINPCDGQCHNNPSGLFSDPDRPNYFIQCGSSYHCKCCVPYHRRCATGTMFDSITRVCTSLPLMMRYH